MATLSKGVMKRFTLDKSWQSPDWSIANVWIRTGRIILGTYAVAQCLLELVIFINHLTSPDISRGTLVEAVSRVIHGLPLYPPPSADFIAMVHTPFFTFLCAGAALLMGVSAATLRLVAIVGTLGAWLVIIFAVRQETKSAWFGLLAAGLFAGAYLAFDGYLDYANPDSWVLFCALLGLYILQSSRAFKWNALAVILLCVAFWFKQHGLLLAGAGLLFVTWRDGLRKSVPYWILAGLLGPLSYVLVGPQLFGKYFLYFTFQVPSAWSVIDTHTFSRYAEYILRHWALLAVISALPAIKAFWQRRRPNIWIFSLPFAILVGFLGTMDPGSENNQYIVPGVWFIIVGIIALSGYLQPKIRREEVTAINTAFPMWLSSALVIAVIALSYGLIFYNPLDAFMSPEAGRDYDDLVQRVSKLDGLVFMPQVGQLPGGLRLSITSHWVSLDDLVRGPGRSTSNHPLIRSILHDLLDPPGNAYIITEGLLEQDALLGFLAPDYKLVEDWGDQYKSLRAVPGRFPRGWPRYLYTFKGQ